MRSYILITLHLNSIIVCDTTEIILDLELIPYRYLSCCKSVTETGLNCVDPSMAFKNVRSCINNLFIFCDSFNVKVIA